MTSRPLWRVTATILPEADEAVSELLSTLCEQPAVSYTDLETGQTTVSVYLPGKPDWPAVGRELRAGLEVIRDCGLKLGTGRITLARVRREDWSESWKRHFRPMLIGGKLLVKPSWSRQRARKGQAVVVLDPGLSFGTGQHPTTSFCLEELVRRRQARGEGAMLDIGTGSGILAIAATVLGYRPVRAFDFDPESVKVARANARVNGVGRRIRIEKKDVRELIRHARGQYTVVAANLMANLLLAERDRITTQVAPGGLLVLAGILKTEFSQVQRSYEEAGMRLVRSKAKGEWRSGSFESKPGIES
ncbi:MAG TPA: 50S ribosomal protein L11 methyltransferase [Clostridia bacterium]|nr:50S ribosomal protein L11 methyltransferase [Clostridia bacterium]